MDIWKLGCSWGDRSQAPVFYDLLIKRHIVICDRRSDLHKGDYAAIAIGHNIKAVAEILSDEEPSENRPYLEEDFTSYRIDIDGSFVSDANIYILEDDIKYSERRSGYRITKPEVKNKIIEKIKELKNKKMTKDITKLLLNNHNVILTGAPGTGKTYRAKEVAADIIGCETKDLSKNQQYGFVQFHPSYDYTDFVEGLRPLKNKEEDIAFELKDGVFKIFCEKALDAYLHPSFDTIYTGWLKEKTSQNIKEMTLELKKTGAHTCPYVIEDNNIRISYPDNGNEYVITKDNLKALFDYYSKKKDLDMKSISMNDIKDVIHMDDVKIDTSYYWSILNELITINNKHKVYDKYVFVIDEINRGELSKIFGELFFSIDPDYRGEVGAVQTQYANLLDKPNAFDEALGAEKGNYGHFFVPENVYIIGTMNDIDRSVESMDFAMRRRFSWKEITAEDSMQMLDNYFEDDELRKVQKRMKKLNDEILKIPGLGSAYQIGGAYFKKYKKYHNFDDLWNNHLKGLLYEYLRGNRDIESRLKQLKAAYDNDN